MTGDGILDYSKQASDDTQLAQAKEEALLAVNEWAVYKKTPEGAGVKFADFMDSKLKTGGDSVFASVEATDVASEGLVTLKDGTKFEITETGTITVIGGTEETPGGGSGEGEVTEAAGLYKTDGTFVAWENLILEGVFQDLSDGVIYSEWEKRELLEGKLVINEGITGLGGFYQCESLTEVILPSTLTTVDSIWPFQECSKLIKISVDANNQNFSTENGILFNKDKTVLIAYPMGKTETVYNVPNSVTEIKENAFSNCTTLTKVTIPNTVENIATEAFSNCTSLSDINPASVDTIGINAFSGTLWIETERTKHTNSLVVINNNIVDTQAVTGDVIIPEGVTEIPELSFGFVMGMGNNNITSVTISSTVTKIGYGAFGNCQLLETVTIKGNNLTTIGASAFYNCKALETITIPKSVTIIEGGAFDIASGSSSLTTVNYTGTETEWNQISIDSWGNYSLTKITPNYNYVAQ